MTGAMGLLVRYRVSLAIVLAAAAGVAAMFSFARPAYDAERGSEMFELADVQHHSVAEVRSAFARHGLRLRYDNAPSEPLWLSSEAGPWSTTAFYVVVVTKRRGAMSWGPELDDAWEARLGNVLVHYGGGDGGFLDRVEAAVAALD